MQQLNASRAEDGAENRAEQSRIPDGQPVPFRERVARRAYERFQLRGSAHGQDQEDWFEAERELKEASDEYSSSTAIDWRIARDV